MDKSRNHQGNETIERKDDEITTYDNLWAAVKILLKWKFIAPSADFI